MLNEVLTTIAGLALVLSVSCLMTAVPAAILPISFTLAVIVLLNTGTPATEAIPAFLARPVAYFVTDSFGLLGQRHKEWS